MNWKQGAAALLLAMSLLSGCSSRVSEETKDLTNDTGKDVEQDFKDLGIETKDSIQKDDQKSDMNVTTKQGLDNLEEFEEDLNE